MGHLRDYRPAMWYNLTILFTVGSSFPSRTNDSTTTAVFVSVKGGINDTGTDEGPIAPARVIVETPADPNIRLADPTRPNLPTFVSPGLSNQSKVDAAAVQVPPQSPQAPTMASTVVGKGDQGSPKKTSFVIVESPALAQLKANISEAIAVGMNALGKSTTPSTTIAPGAAVSMARGQNGTVLAGRP